MNIRHAQDDVPETTARPRLTAGVTRGTCRLLNGMDFTPLTEFKLSSSRRADIAGVDRQGRFLIVEVKSAADDFRADTKWPEYIPHCDWFYFAVPADFPRDLLPPDHGLIIADAFEAVIARPAVEVKMNGTRRRTQLLRFARQAAERHWHHQNGA